MPGTARTRGVGFQMDSFEFNKIAGALLFTALMIFGLKELAGVIYHADAPEKPGMVVETAEAATGGQASEAATEETVSIASLLASADATRGNRRDGVDDGGGSMWR